MEDPQGYQQLNNMQSRDLEIILKECPFEWKENARIMDIGCGDGSTTVNYLKKYIPENFTTVIGSDKSQACIEFAKKKYECKKVKFITLDIEKDVPSELMGVFNYVVSNYTFHWVRQQEKAFSNIYKMMSKNGNCLIIFLGNCDVFDNYRKLSSSAKWSDDLKDVETKFITPYQDSQDPETEIRSFMMNIGFRDIKVQAKNKQTFHFARGVEEFRDLMECINPFDGLKDKWEEFMDDYIKLNPNSGTVVYQLLVVSATK